MPWKFGFPLKKLKRFCKFPLSPPPPIITTSRPLFSIPPLIKKKLTSWIFKNSRRFQLSDNSLHRAWHNGGCRKLGVMGQGWGGMLGAMSPPCRIQHSFLLTVQFPTCTSRDWLKINFKLGQNYASKTEIKQ